jgi:O-antigen/teichoic acid export membrane protein
MHSIKQWIHGLLRRSERYTRTDMVYLASSSFWLNLNFVVVSALSLLLSVAFANILPKSEYGIYQYVLAIAALLTAFTFTGMNAAITQAVANGREGVLRTSVRIQLAWNIVPAGVAFLGAIYYFVQGNAVLGFGLACIAVSLPITNAFNSYAAFFNGKKNFRSSALYAISGNVLYYCAIFAGVFLFPTAAPLIFINLFVTAGAAVTLYLWTLRVFKPNNIPDNEAIPYARHLTGINVLGLIAAHVDKILVFQFLGAASLASYALAILLPERLGGAFKSILLAAFPRFSNRSITEIRESIYWKSFLVLVLTLGCAIAYTVIAPPVLRMLYPEYLDIIPYSQVYAFTFVTTIAHLVTMAFVAHKRLKELYVFNTTVPILQIGALLLGIYLWGLWGLIIARIFSAACACVLALTLLQFGKEDPMSTAR